jgi:hypothetical protein
MKFRKEDVGLYLAAGLAGGGLGLLVGALVASRLAEPIYIPEEELENDPVADRYQVPNVEKYLNEKIAGEKKPRKKRIKFKAEDDPDLAAFIAEWEPSTIQIEMLKTGQATMEEVETVILDDRLSKEIEPYNYSAPYFDKPDLSELVADPEDEEVIDDRYQLLQEAPPGKSTKSVRVIYYDRSDESWSARAKNGRPVPTNLDKMRSPETEIMVKAYLEKDYEVLYVNDLETTKFYRFEVIPDDQEDSSDNGSVT